MSKPVARVLLSVLVSLAVIFAIYTTVQSASLTPGVAEKGSHSVSGALTNFNHDRFTAAEQQQYQSELESYQDSAQDSGRGCESEKSTSPID